MIHFIAGIAIGAVSVVAYNKNKDIKKNVDKGIDKVKEVAETSYAKTKEFTNDVKATVSEKINCLKSKKDCEEKELTKATS